MTSGASPVPSNWWRLLPCLVALVVVRPSTTVGEEAEPIRVVYPDAETVLTLPRGVPIIVHGRYLGRVEREFQLWNTPVVFVLADEKLTRQLLDFRPNRDTIAVYGSLRANGGDNEGDCGAVFDVTAVAPSPDSVTLFREMMKTLFARPDRTAAEVLRLAVSLHRLGTGNPDPDLSALLERAVFEGFRLRRQGLDSKDARALLELIVDIYRQVPERGIHAGLLRTAAERFPQHPGIAARLTKLGYRFVRGGWTEYGEFKKRQGFVQYRKGWIKTVDREFLAVLGALARDDVTNLILRTHTDRSYRQLAELGKVERGMSYREVSMAIGFADRVRRRKLGKSKVDQWDYGDARVYFLAGQVYTSRKGLTDPRDAAD